MISIKSLYINAETTSGLQLKQLKKWKNKLLDVILETARRSELFSRAIEDLVSKMRTDEDSFELQAEVILKETFSSSRFKFAPFYRKMSYCVFVEHVLKGLGVFIPKIVMLALGKFEDCPSKE